MSGMIVGTVIVIVVTFGDIPVGDRCSVRSPRRPISSS